MVPRFAGLQPAAIAKKATYELDKNHSSVYFEVLHLGLAKVMGRLNTMDGTFVVDPADLTKSTVEFSADIAAIDTAIPARDKHLRSADFFDAEKFPKLTFKGTKIEKRGADYVINGDLTIKGKTKNIAIPFKFFGPYKVPGFDFPPSIGVLISFSHFASCSPKPSKSNNYDPLHGSEPPSSAKAHPFGIRQPKLPSTLVLADSLTFKYRPKMVTITSHTPFISLSEEVGDPKWRSFWVLKKSIKRVRLSCVPYYR